MKKNNTTKLKTEIAIYSALIKELLIIITKNKIKLPQHIMNIVSVLYPIKETKNDK